ncbi:MAG: helix-turn-helix domain-containing protein [Solirubrobacterales bacterium]
MSAGDAAEMQIGRVLKEARTRAGLDVRTVEEQTKIRVKYLRALEDEQWEVLPSPAYAKGFLRTYAQVLGLDGEALVDEFRRQVELERGEPAYPLGDQVPERRRRPGEPLGGGGPSWRPLLIGAAVLVVGVLLVLGITGGDDEGEGGGRDDPRREARQERREERRQERRREQRRAAAEAEAEKVALELDIVSPVTVCLLGPDNEELIDGQVLAAGTTEGPFNAERFQLRFPSGYDREFFELRLGGERVRVPETQGPTAFSITAPGKVRRAPEPGLECP